MLPSCRNFTHLFLKGWQKSGSFLDKFSNREGRYIGSYPKLWQSFSNSYKRPVFVTAHCRRKRGVWNFRSLQRKYTVTAKMASSTLCMKDFDVVGFDMDHTLAQYNLPALLDLIHNGFTKFLVEKRGFNKDLAEPFSKWRDFCQRGLFFDIKRGNFLKIAKDGTILRATHGTKFLSDSEITAAYGSKKWEYTEKMLNTFDNIADAKGERLIMVFDNLFDMNGTLILGRVVDLADKENGKPLDSYNVQFMRVAEAFDDIYNIANFEAKTGGFFPAMIDNPSKYLVPCSDKVKAWIKSLRASGKVVFFMTSSYIDYTKHVLENTLGPDWNSYFDVGISRAKKPTFFTAGRPFLRLDGNKEKEPIQSLEKGNFYSQGNLKDFTNSLIKLSGKDNPKVLYFGDSLRSDSFPSKTQAGWSTVSIIDEIIREIPPATDGQPAIKRQKLESTDTETEECLSSNAWGSIFCDGAEALKEKTPNTLFSQILSKSSDVAISSLNQIAELPLDHKFTTFSPDKTSPSGFYPTPPKVLQKK